MQELSKMQDRYDTFRYRFSPVIGKYKNMRSQVLTSHSYCTEAGIAAWNDYLSANRRNHRDEVGRLITEAIYEGWFPDGIEWYEGEPDYDLPWDGKSRGTDDEYHFFTRVHLVAPVAYPLMERKVRFTAGEDSPMIRQWRPKDLK